MYNSISGTVTAKLPSSLYLDNAGIEWDIIVPSLSLDFFGPVGSQARVYTWLYHREDQMRFFGFHSVRERDVFIDLMKVEGIGPKQAIKILSGISAGELEKALDGEDLSRLESAPGIGKKTAQKMILTLKGKLTRDSETVRRTEKKSLHEDIIVALVQMGFDRRATVEAVETIAEELKADGAVGAKVTAKETEQEIFRRSIVALSS
jgi:Holliday junction DNA helicase RuvA